MVAILGGHTTQSQWERGYAEWLHRPRTSMNAILEHLELPTMEQIITVWILRFLGKVPLMQGGRSTL
jgi:hypothetical protein